MTPFTMAAELRKNLQHKLILYQLLMTYCKLSKLTIMYGTHGFIYADYSTAKNTDPFTFV